MGLGVREVRCGTRLSFPGAPGFSIEVLHPGPEDSYLSGREENDHSLALRLRGGNSRLLILGDLKEKGVARLFQRGDDLRADVLVAPHHGRPNLLWPEILEAVRPAALVITGGGAQSSRRVAASVEAKGIPVFATWRRGAVRMLWSASRGWEASYWRDG